MKTRLTLLAALCVALLSSCSTLKYHYSETRIAEANTDVFVIPPTARVDVNPEAFVDVWVFEGRDLKSILTPGINMEELSSKNGVATSLWRPSSTSSPSTTAAPTRSPSAAT